MGILLVGINSGLGPPEEEEGCGGGRWVTMKSVTSSFPPVPLSFRGRPGSVGPAGEPKSPHLEQIAAAKRVSERGENN